jgi:hypothetical protein
MDAMTAALHERRSAVAETSAIRGEFGVDDERPAETIRRIGSVLVAGEVIANVEASAVLAVTALGEADLGAGSGSGPASAAAPGISLAALRSLVARDIRRHASVRRDDALQIAADVLDRLIEREWLVRDGDRVFPPGHAAGPPAAMRDAMDQLERTLSVAAPPSLAEAARAAGCPPEGIRLLESTGRIVRLEDDLAWAAVTLRELEDLALRLAENAPLAPAAFRDATGTSRRYALAVIEDLDRRGILRRTPAGHVPGPRAQPVKPAS